MEIIFYISNAISIIFIGQVGKVWGSGVGGKNVPMCWKGKVSS